MLQHTVSLWRRLVGKTEQAAVEANAATADERRLWVRYPADLNALVQAAGNQDTRLSAKVRDVSQGGACLLMNRTFQPGQLLSLELPSADATAIHTVLACVVRASPESGGQWAIGCVFARELTAEDMEGFGAQKVRPAPPDKRTWMRFPTNIKATYQKIGDAEQLAYSARVLNLSASGIGLLVKDAIETGALLSLDLVGASASRTILACVVHATTHGNDELALGCNFIRELGEEDLQALLA